MVITESQIRRIMPKAKSENIKAFVATFNKYSEQFELNTNMRVSHFIGQIAHEASELNAIEENLNYSAEGLLRTFPKYFKTSAEAAAYARKPMQIANRVYANRMGNGDEKSGDGWKYKGRGIIMLTGKSNYKAYQNSGYCVGDLLSHPEWLAQYPGALKSAMWFWKANNLNSLADRDDGSKITGDDITKLITKRINGGILGLAQRQYYVRTAKRVFGI